MKDAYNRLKLAVANEVLAQEELWQTAALKAYLTKESVIDFVGEQTLEETAEGEAFFDNVRDTEEAVTGIAAAEQLTLIRQGAFGGGECSISAPLPKPVLVGGGGGPGKANRSPAGGGGRAISAPLPKPAPVGGVRRAISAPLPKPKLCRASTTAAKAAFLAGEMTAQEAIASNGLGVAGNPPAIALLGRACAKENVRDRLKK